ncbi:glycoside hydrolase family 97 protein [Asticcacaulis sp.]|uniref:glycoside hydrolase family 97 protein n=1 Tax=Asticcacaulis sp. TaxID=1872648 RepID=UPI002C34CECE|nr:glycoside hydrolase family 97 catalytic domain-containing protein [Asticcacaulis sp.]HTM82293.1 glycoside hydrolase family 97 catalytic domain-containing protein [Asticcacaulis sp.]
MLELIAAAAAAQIVVSSPDGSVKFRLADDGAGYAAYRRNEEVVSGSQLGLQLSNAPAFSHLVLVKRTPQNENVTHALTATKADTARDYFNGELLSFRENDGAHREISIEVRVYNEGVAWRYILPGGAAVSLAGETTEYRPAGDPSCLVSEYAASHEKDWNSVRMSEIDQSKLYDYPVVCPSPSGNTQYAIVQAGLSGYAGSALKPGKGVLQVQLFSRLDHKEVAVEAANGLQSGWRVIMMADRAGDLIESHLIGNLSAQATGDYSWVKPGKVAWDWWSGPTVGDKPTMERYRRFIDFAAESGFPYFLIDSGWALNTGPCCAADPRTDITKGEAGIDMPALAKYAASRGVGLILWVHWQHVAPRMDEVLDTYAAWGIKGIKVDFMERDDQEMVAFYEKLAAATAKRHMLLDMHGAFPPMGLSRTYPNYITQEGVLGAEYNKFPWGKVTPAHNVKLAYTRMLLGPMDYTPGGFRNSYPDAYVQTEVMPSTRFTRGQALAQYVVYDSPLQMVSDDPSAYRDADGFDFVKAVPTSWDETRFIDGTPDSYVVVARRKNNAWYVGAINNEVARVIEIPLTFLADKPQDAVIWSDGASANQVSRTVRTVSRGQSLSVKMPGGGGAVIVITP